MTAFIWLIAIVLGVAAFVTLLSAIVAAARAHRTSLVVLNVVLMLGLVAVVVLGRNPWALGAVALMESALALFIVKRTTRNAAHMGGVMQLSAAHCTLLVGSLLFLIPFAWLISTSLKTDEEQAIFPPVWIPTQQITAAGITNAEDEPAGVSWYLKDSPKQVKVAEIANLQSGRVLVQLLQPQAGTGKTEKKTFEANRSELTKIREVSPRWRNYAEALEFLPPETHYGLTFLGNTLFLTIMTVMGTLLSSSLVAYSFARLHWPGRNLLFVVLLATMMIPSAVTMMPQFLIFRSLGWVDTLLPLWVPAFFGSAFNIFLLRQFFMSIPTELEDAAKIDGCGPLGIYWWVMLPQVKPALAAIGIMSVMAAWNNFQGPLIYLSSPEKMTLAYALQLYQQQHGGEPGLLMAASTLVVLPIIVLFFFTQRYFIEGVSLSGLGGR
jgi:multiple sugar transport system permease protein